MARRERWNPLLCSYPQSERVNECTMGAEVLFVRLIAQADDYGNYYADPGLVLAYLFGHRLAKGEVSVGDVRDWIGELQKAGLVNTYEAGSYLHVANPRRRLRKDVKADQRFPIDPWTKEVEEDGSTATCREQGPQETHQDRACTKPGPNPSRVRPEYGPPDTDTESEANTDAQSMDGNAAPPSSADSDCTRVMEHLNRATKRSGPSLFRTYGGLKQRLVDGASVGDCLMVIDHKVAQWNGNEEMRPYIRPKTLFSPANFPGYLAEARQWNSRGRPSLRNGRSRTQAASGRDISEYAELIKGGVA